MNPTIPGMKLVPPEPPPVPADQLAIAKTIIRLARGHRVRSSALRPARLHPYFQEIARELALTVPEGRSDFLWFWVNLYKARTDRPDAQAACTALIQAVPMVEAEPDDPEPDPAPPAVFSLEAVDTATFFGEEEKLTWLVDDALIEEQTCVVGGPSKSLKTSVLIDLVVSLASGTPFLGRFNVPVPTRVGFISGESGRQVIRANAKQVCIARDLSYDQAAGVLWGFKLPALSNPDHMTVVRSFIADNGLKALVIDPVYLALLAGNTSVDASNMFQMGPLLSDIAALCIDEKCTPLLVHHSRKQRENAFEPMEINELAYAGFDQFARQWMLISRREKYDDNAGIHRMHFRYGGSATFSGLIHVDIDTGKIDKEFKGRKWDVTTRLPSETMVSAQQDRESVQVQKTMDSVRMAALKKTQTVDLAAEACYQAVGKLAASSKIGLAKTGDIAAELGVNGSRTKLLLDRLKLAERIEEVPYDSDEKVPGAKPKYYRLPTPKPLAVWESED